jgi:hypothetical protein
MEMEGRDQASRHASRLRIGMGDGFTYVGLIPYVHPESAKGDHEAGISTILKYHVHEEEYTTMKGAFQTAG